MSKQRKRRRPPAPYDVDMIRDFLDNLMWELRTSHFECIGRVKNPLGKPNFNPELADQFAYYLKKYGGRALLSSDSVEFRVATDEQRAAAEAAIRWLYQRKGEKRQLEIEHLEAMRELFDEATTAASSQGWPVVRHTVTTILKQMEEGNEDGGEDQFG